MVGASPHGATHAQPGVRVTAGASGYGVHMKKLIGTLLIASVVLVGCGDDDGEEAAGTEEFCAEVLQTGATASGITTGFPGVTEASITEALLYFRRLEDTAPEVISDDVTTVTTGLEAIVEAFAEFQGVEGEEAFAAVSEAAQVDLDEIARAADEVEQYARNNCEDFPTG